LTINSAIIIYQYIFQLRYFGVLHILTLYIILGIGADDIFVFYDTWKNSASKGKAIAGDLSTRLSWTFRRASKAMLVTSATTFVAFVATAVTPFVGIQTFGVFAATLVLVNYLIVITFFPCVVGTTCFCLGTHSRY
jgi:predicted RND superfamily exporter protein